MFKVAVCAGHGGFGVTPGKRSPAGEYEWDFNNKVVLSFIEAMNKYENVEVRRYDDPSGHTDVPLRTRTNKANAWGADIYISFHHNANTAKWGNWTGTETFTYTGAQPKSTQLAKCVHKEMLKAYGLRDRGIKKMNLHIVRETKMPAILVEGGFMDSVIDIKKLRDNSVLKSAGVHIAKGVADYAGLKQKSGSSSTASKPTVKPSAPHPSAAATYVVEKGDTLWGISKENGLTVNELKSLNGLKSDTITVGQKLVLKKANAALRKIKVDKLNSFTYVYEKESDKSTRLGKAKRNDVLEVASITSGYFEVLFKGKKGFIKKKYCTLQ